MLCSGAEKCGGSEMGNLRSRQFCLFVFNGRYYTREYLYAAINGRNDPMVREKAKDADGDRGNNFKTRLFKRARVGGVLATQRTSPVYCEHRHTAGELVGVVL